MEEFSPFSVQDYGKVSHNYCCSVIAQLSRHRLYKPEATKTPRHKDYNIILFLIRV